ncbi:hypothetical protein AX17_006481 [Amanita inopinata Kibby_2008]|nr:hypothetical protein AX17_006481 [Amanita inopinata Kibby_2008]
MNIVSPRNSRPATPESPLTGSLYQAALTIEDLTSALADFSHRVPSPDPPVRLTCCCGKEDCENLGNWIAVKARLESRLRLSAEVGQALLQRHEAYVRRHEPSAMRRVPTSKSIGADSSSGGSDDMPSQQEETDSYVCELLKEKALLEKRLNQALVNNEVSEVSTKSILQELDEARATISRLTANQARSAGWDVRLSQAVKERNDMQQERDVESQRARLAESRFAALKEKAAKLQMEVRRLQEALESKRVTRMESSESTLQDARIQIQLMQSGRLLMTEHDELMRVLGSLVNDNETLKRDNDELQKLLSDCREDLHALQEEVEEQRLNPQIPSKALKHKHSKAASLSIMDFSMHVPEHLAFEPLTPETNRRPLSPTTYPSSPSEPTGKWTTTITNTQYPPPPTHISYDLEIDTIDDEKSILDELTSHQTRSRGIQTAGPWIPSVPFSHLRQFGQVSSSPLSNGDPRSESSSYSSDTLASHMSTLLDRLLLLFTKLSQADALTLTNRLKRQHLYRAPGDVKHLSRSTVNQILSEIVALRSQFRALLEDDKVIAVCTRKDIRVLFRLAKEMFGEMGRMRVVLNDVILDPGQAGRISEMAMDPSKAEREGREGGSKGGKDAWDGTLSWMAPLSKFFSPGHRGEKHVHLGSGGRLAPELAPMMAKSVSGRSGVVGGEGGIGQPRPPRTITVPKIAPALAASTTTVNVEFSGAGIGGKTVTNTFSRSGDSGANRSAAAPPVSVSLAREQNSPDHAETSSGASAASRGVMDIFAGAPTRNARMLEPESWVVLPKGPRRVQSSIIQVRPGGRAGMSSIGRETGRSTPVPALNADISEVSSLRGAMAGLSRYVDAVIDPGTAFGPRSALSRLLVHDGGDEGGEPGVDGSGNNADERPPLRRGLSDSSIHSTFSTHGAGNEDGRLDSANASMAVKGGVGVSVLPSRQLKFPAVWPDKQSVLQALSRTVQNFRLGHGVGAGAGAASKGARDGVEGHGRKASESGQDQESQSTTTASTTVERRPTLSPSKRMKKPRQSAPPKIASSSHATTHSQTRPNGNENEVGNGDGDGDGNATSDTSNMSADEDNMGMIEPIPFLSSSPTRDPFVVGSMGMSMGMGMGMGMGVSRDELSLLHRTYKSRRGPRPARDFF